MEATANVIPVRTVFLPGALHLHCLVGRASCGPCVAPRQLVDRRRARGTRCCEQESFPILLRTGGTATSQEQFRAGVYLIVPAITEFAGRPSTIVTADFRIPNSGLFLRSTRSEATVPLAVAHRCYSLRKRMQHAEVIHRSIPSARTARKPCAG